MPFRVGNEGMPPVPAHLAAIIPDNEPADLGPVLVKMLLFTLAMVVLPVGSYYVSRDYYFGEQGTTGAGITAATVANLVLAVFVWVAFREDDGRPVARVGEKEGAKKGEKTEVVPKEDKKKK